LAAWARLCVHDAKMGHHGLDCFARSYPQSTDSVTT
jgi:hypothetical protein